MKKTLINMALGGSIMLSVAFFGAHKADAQNIDLSQFRALVQLLIAIGAIPADKADIARNFVGITSSTPIVTASSTPIFISGSNVQSNTSASVEPTLGAIAEIDDTPTFSEPDTFTFVNPVSGAIEHPYNYLAELHRLGARIEFTPDIKRSTKDASSWILNGYATKKVYGNSKHNLVFQSGDPIISGSGNWYGVSVKAAYPSDYDSLDMNAKFRSDYSR